MANFYGWQPSLLSRDLSSGGEWGATNIHMNQAFADIQARSTLYMTPTMGCGAFIDYGSPCGGMNFLLDPRYTIQQWQWNNNNGGGFNPWGNMGTGMNWNNPWSNWGWNGGNTQGSSSSASTPTERAFQKKYNKLLSLVKQLASDDSKLPAARKDALDEIIKHPVGKTYEEKFNNLKEEYNRISKEDIKKFLASNASSKFGIDGKDTTEANSFYGKLQSIGYEFDNSKVDSEISRLYDTISSITDTNEGKYQQESSILSNLASPSSLYDILDVVSSWNTQKKDSTGKDKRIIDLIKEKYDAIPAGTEGDPARSSIKTQVISPVVNSLINRARDLKSNLDSASQTKMQNAMTKLEDAYNATKDKVDSGLSKAFDELYVLTRKAAIAQLRADINETYGAIDPDLFNDTLFEAETIADLKAEGFTETDISAANVAVVASNDSGVYTQRVDETKPARDQLAEITGSDKALSKATSVTGISGVTEAWIDNNTGKVYIIKKNSDDEEEIHEVTSQVEVNNGTVTFKENLTTTKVSANDIQTASAEAKREKEALATEKDSVASLLTKTDIITEQSTTVNIGGTQCKVYKETKGEQREFVLVDGVLYEYKNGSKGDKVTAESIESAYNSALKDEEHARENDLSSVGTNVAKRLCEWTTEADDKYIARKLDAINEDNVLSFMKGVYSNSSFNHKGCEGFIEKLDDDTYASNGVTLDKKKNLINSFIEAAVKTGKISRNDDLIVELKECIEDGQDGEGFNNTYDSASGATWTGIGVGAAAGTAAGAKWGAGIGTAIGAWFGGVGAGPGAIIGTAVGAVVGAVSGGVTAWSSKHTNYNERIDELMFDIWEKIKPES